MHEAFMTQRAVFSVVAALLSCDGVSKKGASSMERIEVEGTLTQSPGVIWRYLTDHEGMVRWAGVRAARVLRSIGEGGAGTIRRLELPLPLGRTIAIDEEVCAVAPELRFEYRIIRGLPFRHHYGVISLEPYGTGTRLRWSVNFDMHLPGTALVFGKRLRVGLERAVEGLDRLASAEYSEAGTTLVGRIPEAADAPWRARLAERMTRQHVIVVRFERARSSHAWFARMLLRIMGSGQRISADGGFVHPAWVLRILVRLHELYESNLDLWETGQRDQVEGHWARAFGAAERGDRWPHARREGSRIALNEASWALSSEDLPRAMATILFDCFSGRDDFRPEVFREDFARLLPSLDAAERLIIGELPGEDWLQASVRMLGRVLDRVADRESSLSLVRARSQAWDRALLMLALLEDPDGQAGRRTPPAVEGRRQISPWGQSELAGPAQEES